MSTEPPSHGLRTPPVTRLPHLLFLLLLNEPPSRPPPAISVDRLRRRAEQNFSFVHCSQLERWKRAARLGRNRAPLDVARRQLNQQPILRLPVEWAYSCIRWSRLPPTAHSAAANAGGAGTRRGRLGSPRAIRSLTNTVRTVGCGVARPKAVLPVRLPAGAEFPAREQAAVPVEPLRRGPTQP